MSRYTRRDHPAYNLGKAADSPHAVPGAGLDVLLAIASNGHGHMDQGRAHKTWFWLVEMRVHLGKVTQCHNAGFVMAPPGDLTMAIITEPPHGDRVDQFITGMTGYLVVNRNLDRLALSADGKATANFMLMALQIMAEEPGAIDDLIHWHERLAAIEPTQQSPEDLLHHLAQDSHCPGLGPVALGQALFGELHYVEHRADMELIARDEAISPVHLGVNDNVPQPEVCSEPPVFEELGS
ncbi:MAG: hypothetical protein AAF213_04585 [Pseudomonadota bacterium]